MKSIAGLNLRACGTNHKLGPVITQQVFTAKMQPSFLAVPFCCCWQKWPGCIRTPASPLVGYAHRAAALGLPAYELGTLQPADTRLLFCCPSTRLPPGFNTLSLNEEDKLLAVGCQCKQIGKAGTFQEH